MSLKASSFKNNDAQNKSIAKEVLHILNRMDDELKTAHESGKHEVRINVPINFSVPFMKNKDAQRIVYYKILESLIKRGFIASLNLTKNISIIHITWLSDGEKLEIKIQNDLLAKCTKKNHLRDINKN